MLKHTDVEMHLLPFRYPIDKRSVVCCLESIYTNIHSRLKLKEEKKNLDLFILFKQSMRQFSTQSEF